MKSPGFAWCSTLCSPLYSALHSSFSLVSLASFPLFSARSVSAGLLALLVMATSSPAAAAPCAADALSLQDLPFAQRVEDDLVAHSEYRLEAPGDGWLELELVSLSPQRTAPMMEITGADCEPLMWRSFGPVHRLAVDAGEVIHVALRTPTPQRFGLTATAIPAVRPLARGVVFDADGTGGGVNEQDPDDPGLWSPPGEWLVWLSSLDGILFGADDGGGVNEQDPDDPGLWSPTVSLESSRQSRVGVFFGADGTGGTGTGAGTGTGTGGGGVNEQDPDDPGLWSPPVGLELALRSSSGILFGADDGGGVNEQDPDDPGLTGPMDPYCSDLTANLDVGLTDRLACATLAPQGQLHTALEPWSGHRRVSWAMLLLEEESVRLHLTTSNLAALRLFDGAGGLIDQRLVDVTAPAVMSPALPPGLYFLELEALTGSLEANGDARLLPASPMSRVAR